MTMAPKAEATRLLPAPVETAGWVGMWVPLVGTGLTGLVELPEGW